LDPAILQESFAALAGRGPELAEDFYAHLFPPGGPAVIDLFPAHMARQRSRLVDALITIVAQAGDLDALAGYLDGLGRHHRIYAARPEHFPLVGECLLATLREAAGPAWTEEVAGTWAAAYALVAQVMTGGLTAAGGTPPWWDATVTGTERRGLDVAVVHAKLDGTDGPGLAWAPGQSFGVKISAWPSGRPTPRAWRFYSPAHLPRDDGTLTLHVKVTPGGVMSTALARRSLPGTRLRVTPPVGALRLDEASGRDVVMVAGSTGLAPLLAITEALARRPQPPRAALLFGARWPDGLYWAGELDKLAAGCPWLEVTCAVSGAVSETPGWDGPRGLIADVAAGRDWAGRDGYVCGGHAMTAAARAALTAAGAAAVHIEDFGQGA
jgi:NAD(P)H-flavin reductase/hemoglobin-like flavoprotein